MSDADEGDVEETRDVPNRVRSLHAVIEVAIERAQRRGYGQKFTSTDVQEWAEVDLPSRTLRRALHDAVALGWIEQQRQRWKPAERAEEHAPEPEATPNGTIARANPDDSWHLLKGGSETMCETDLDLYGIDSEAERRQFNRFNDAEVDADDLCLDCLGI